MSDWLGLGIIAFIILCALFGLYQLTKPYDITIEEFEKRAHEAPGMMSAAFTGLQKILDPATKKAVEAQEDFKEGRYNSEQAKGDGLEPGAGEEGKMQ